MRRGCCSGSAGCAARGPRDNVSVDVSAVAYFRVVDAVKSVVAIENVYAAIDQIAQTTLRKVVGHLRR
jgi:regulator of protease activity HflC (stomatin/prohibitin superfamily)